MIIGQKGILLFFVSFERNPGQRLSSARTINSLEPLAITEFVVEQEEITAIIINANTAMLIQKPWLILLAKHGQAIAKVITTNAKIAIIRKTLPNTLLTRKLKIKSISKMA